MVSRAHKVALAGATVSAVLIALFALSTPPISPSASQSIGLPVRLQIPTLGVDAAIEYVGVTPDGLMGAPKDLKNVAWYELGPRPGDIGSAVIDGHSGWKDATPAAFDTLDKIAEGDRIVVEDARGAILTFIVRKIKVYDPKADTDIVFNTNDGRAHLNLITCEGVWDAVARSYAKRLIIFADSTT